MKRIICFFKGHQWNGAYSTRHEICDRCTLVRDKKTKMKIYILIVGDQSDREYIKGVFSSRAKAEECRNEKMANNNWNSDLDWSAIQMYIIDMKE